jgi:glycosyltransferase involved in cell wall biosynthesis
MAAGLPVVATAVGAIPHFVKDGEDGFLIAPRRPEELAERVCCLLADQALRARIGARVRERAVREFSIEAGCARVAEVIRETLGDVPAVVPDPEPGARR